MIALPARRGIRAHPLKRPARRRPRSRPPALTFHEVGVAGLPAALDGLRLAHLTDVHVQRLLRPRHLDRAVELVLGAEPDLVLLTGDYVCFHRGAIPRLALSLARLPSSLPRLAVLGNHDHLVGGAGVRAALERIGIVVLQNEHAVVEARGEKLAVVGVDDPRTRRHDPVRAFAGVPELPLIALAHDPSAADALVPYGPSLILAGHTHGGQIRIPGLTERVAGRMGQRYLSGMFALSERTTLFVSRGLGQSLPVRVASPPEVAILTLRSR